MSPDIYGILQSRQANEGQAVLLSKRTGLENAEKIHFRTQDGSWSHGFVHKTA